jgi:hypothetical protein
MSEHFDAGVYLKLGLGDKGIVDVRIAVDTAEEQASAHELLASISTELRELDTILKKPSIERALIRLARLKADVAAAVYHNEEQNRETLAGALATGQVQLVMPLEEKDNAESLAKRFEVLKKEIHAGLARKFKDAA